jgi:hypothetical protein
MRSRFGWASLAALTGLAGLATVIRTRRKSLDSIPWYRVYVGRRRSGQEWSMALTIGQVATAADVNIQTIRYYERRGLFPAPRRTAA